MSDGRGVYPVGASLLLKTKLDGLVEEPNDQLLELFWVVLVATVAAVGQFEDLRVTRLEESVAFDDHVGAF